MFEALYHRVQLKMAKRKSKKVKSRKVSRKTIVKGRSASDKGKDSKVKKLIKIAKTNRNKKPKKKSFFGLFK